MKSIHRISLLVVAGAALALSSCAPGGRSPSGFLANYRQLDAGYGTEDAVSAYVKPGADLKKYDSVIIEPVTTVVGQPGIGAEVKDQLAAYVADALRSQSRGGMKIVNTPGPATLRVRTALTDVVEGRNPGGPAIATVHPSPRATLGGRIGSEPVAAFVANVSFEGEIVDSVTGERLCALADHRLATKRDVTARTQWTEVRDATKQGAARLWQRFMAAKAM
jgi:hypothetical protein